MAMRDLHNHIKKTRGLSPVSGAADTAAQTSQTIDGQGYNSQEWVISLGSLADADATFAVVMNESDDSGMSGSTAVAAADLIGTLAAASFQFDDDNAVKSIGYKGSKRYTNLVVTPTANTGAWLISIVVLQGKARHFPAGSTQTP